MSDSSSQVSSGGLQAKTNKWLIRLGVAAGIIIVISVIINIFRGKSTSSGSNDDWVTVARVNCTPTWNQARGWCPVLTDAAKGTYRVIPRYTSWQLWQNDGSFITVPPYGLDLYAHWKEHGEFIDEFHRTAHKKGSNNYGTLLVRVGNMEIIEALNSSRAPREFEVTKDGTELAVTVNLTPLANFYQYNQGAIPVEVQRQD